jgi:surface antigen
MMKKILMVFTVVAMTTAVAACNKQAVGTGVGGVAGGVIGSNVGGGSGRTAAIIGGTLLGAVVGGHIGGEMDELDRRRASQALETAPTGRATSWQNPDSGAQYNVTPTRTYESQSGPCREYDMEVYIDGQRDIVKGTACRNSRGEWVNQ